MGSLAYSMAYAANDGYDSSRIPDEWILRNDDGSYWRRGLGSPWWVNTPKGTPKHENHITKMNVNTQGWYDYITDQYVNRGSGTCLTIPNDTTTTSTQAIIAQCSSSSPSQRWSAPVPAGQQRSRHRDRHYPVGRLPSGRARAHAQPTTRP